MTDEARAQESATHHPATGSGGDELERIDAVRSEIIHEATAALWPSGTTVAELVTRAYALYDALRDHDDAIGATDWPEGAPRDVESADTFLHEHVAIVRGMVAERMFDPYSSDREVLAAAAAIHEAIVAVRAARALGCGDGLRLVPPAIAKALQGHLEVLDVYPVLEGQPNEVEVVELRGTAPGGVDMYHTIELEEREWLSAEAWWREFHDLVERFDPWREAHWLLDQNGDPIPDETSYCDGEELFHAIEGYKSDNLGSVELALSRLRAQDILDPGPSCLWAPWPRVA